MKKIYKVFILLLVISLSFLLSSCSNKIDFDFEDNADKYDIIIGDKTQELVTITFKCLNYKDVKEKVWGIEKGKTLGYDYEPEYPHNTITIAEYGLSTDFTPANKKGINLSTYIFDKDTIVYVKYYGGLLTRRFCIPNGATNKGSGMMFEQKSFFYNTEVYSLPTLENQTFETDWGITELKESLSPWVTQWGYSKIVGWYYDEGLTKEVTVPFKINNDDNIWFWMKCE